VEIEAFDYGLIGELDSPEAELLDGSDVCCELWDEVWSDYRATRTPFPN
jgi:hypothetical protein